MFPRVLAIFLSLWCLIAVSGWCSTFPEKPFRVNSTATGQKAGLHLDSAFFIYSAEADANHFSFEKLDTSLFVKNMNAIPSGNRLLLFVLQAQEQASPYYLSLSNEISCITAYHITHGDTTIQYSGTRRTPQTKSHVFHYDNILEVSVSPDHPTYLYVFVEIPPGEYIYPQARLFNKSVYRSHFSKRRDVALIFTAIFIVLALYNFFIYLILREKAYLNYSFMVLGFALHASIPLLYHFFTATFINTLSIPISSGIIFFGARFSIYFLGLQTLPFWKKIMNGLAYINMVVVILITAELLFSSTNRPLDDVCSLIAAFSALCLFVLWIITGAKVWRMRDKRGKYFLMTNIPALAGALVFTLVWLAETFNLAFLEISGALGVNIIFYSGMTIQLLLFSAVFGYYIRKLEREKFEIQANINLQLEQKVKERTANLEAANLKIRGQKDELKALNKIKDKLFSIISHDLRSPLQSLQAMLSMFRSDTITADEMKEYTFKINDALRNTSTVLNNMLNWAKAQMTGIDVHPSSFEIVSLLKENVELIQPLLDKKSIKLVSALQPGIVWADRDMIDLVIRNLLSNAIKFTNSGGKITIKSTVKDSTIEVSITDNGVGMSKEKLESLFDITHLEPTSGTQNEKGTGLGLILSKDFIEMNKGMLKIKSEESKGTTFIIAIPVEAGVVSGNR